VSLSARIFITCVVLIGLSIGLILQSVTDELIPGMRQSLEEVLVDTANLLAEVVEQEVFSGEIGEGDFASQMSAFSQRRVNASISSLQKEDSNLVVYITDEMGKVIYDSTGQNTGNDFSQWNDVYLTLRGSYGARTTRRNPKDANSSVMYVAAPIMKNNQVVGVLSVGKPSVSVQPYFEQAVRAIETKVMMLSFVSLLVVMLLIYWVTLSIRQLTDYARNVQQGKRNPMPVLREKELAQLANAMDAMRVSLEGKNYVENYLHSLTHELKSPLAAIQGAVELLKEDMPVDAREKFIHNIGNESQRMRQVVEQLLKLASLEKRQQLEDVEEFDPDALVLQLCEDKSPVLEQKQIQVQSTVAHGTQLNAERFLVQQAISNLLDNAIDFSKEKDVISINSYVSLGQWHLHIRDHGPGIPDYALANVFERFYSLPRPHNNLKSTGLGLSLVYEVAQLHRGQIKVQNAEGDGVESILSLPLV